MRAAVQENNVYRWAGNLIGDLSEIRIEPPAPQPPSLTPPPVSVGAHH